MSDQARMVERISAVVRDYVRLQFPGADKAVRITALMRAIVEEILAGPVDEARARRRLGHVRDGLQAMFDAFRPAV